MTAVKIDPAGREYVHWPVSGAPFDSADLEFTFDSGVSWHAATWNGDKTIATLLIAGPGITAVGGQVTLTVGRHVPEARLIDNPEVLIRGSLATINIGT